MSVYITHTLPNGEAIVEINVGHTMGGIIAFESLEKAEAAVIDHMVGDAPNQDIVNAENAARAERYEQSGHAKYDNMSTLQLLFDCVKGIRFRRPFSS